eukprot:1156876-Pelagomonas_calceolata.AAC.8
MLPCFMLPGARSCAQRRKLNRQHSGKSGMSSLASSLHSSFDVEDTGAHGGNGGGSSAGAGNGNNGGGGGGGAGSGSLSNSREVLAPLRGVHSGGTSPGSQGGGPLTKGLPLGGPLAKVPPLGSVPASPSASGSDWPALSAPPQHLGTLKVGPHTVKPCTMKY